MAKAAPATPGGSLTTSEGLCPWTTPTDLADQQLLQQLQTVEAVEAVEADCSSQQPEAVEADQEAVLLQQLQSSSLLQAVEADQDAVAPGRATQSKHCCDTKCGFNNFNMHRFDLDLDIHAVAVVACDC